ncbi:MAG: hypothetical protein NZ518_02815, partial [Dehalococcoidia bacterium]|nr:hypothetical protein [Dehalococcoidia bacterium]
TGQLPTDQYVHAAVMSTPLVALLLLGLAPSRSSASWTVSALVVVPIVGMGLLLLLGRDFASRYLFVATPGLILALASGVARATRWRRAAGAVAVAALVVPMALAWQALRDPSTWRDDYRALAAYLGANEEAGDTIVLNAGYQDKALTRYYRGAAPLVAMPPTYPPDDLATARAMTEVAAQSRAIWLALWQDYHTDPRGAVKGWLDRHAFQIDAQVFRGLALYRYLTESPVNPPVPSFADPPTIFGGQIALLGAVVQKDRAGEGSDVRVSLYWQALRPVNASYRVFVHMINPVYHVYAQKDNRPAYDRWPTSLWQGGEVVRDDYRLRPVAGTPPGVYQIAVGLYDERTGRRLPIEGAGRDYAIVGVVETRGVGDPAPSGLVNARFAESVQLVGVDIEGAIVPGGTLRIVAHWRAIGAPDRDWTVFTHLVDASGALIAQKDSQHAAGAYPTSRWRLGEYVRDYYDLSLPSAVATGDYRVLLGLYGPDGQRAPVAPAAADRAVTVATLRAR